MSLRMLPFASFKVQFGVYKWQKKERYPYHGVKNTQEINTVHVNFLLNKLKKSYILKKAVINQVFCLEYEIQETIRQYFDEEFWVNV